MKQYVIKLNDSTETITACSAGFDIDLSGHLRAGDLCVAAGRWLAIQATECPEAGCGKCGGE